jgi:hypothetical protein
MAIENVCSVVGSSNYTLCSELNSFQAISVIRGARYGVFTNKKHLGNGTSLKN